MGTVIRKERKKNYLAFGGLVVLLVVLFIANVTLGSVRIPFEQVVKIFFGGQVDQGAWENIVIKTRLPQTLTALLAGSGLAVGGLQMQTLFRNPLAGPSILGISSGAGLGVAFVLLMVGNIGGLALSSMGFAGDIAVTVAAFFGAICVMVLVLFLAGHLQDNAMLLIVGIMMGYASSAIVGILKFYSPKEDVHSYVIWGLGNFSNVSLLQMQVFLPVVILGLFFSTLLIKPLNVYLLGENYAANLGVNVRQTRFLILGCTGLLTATITAFCGPIAFLGLAVPHLTKGLIRTSNHAFLVPGVILLGAVLSLFCNLVARLPGFDGALPINAVTSVIGAPIVIFVILKRKRLARWH